jgi:hypothetical protein
MSEAAFDILCPKCGSVVPHEASGCPTCAAGSRREAEPLAAVSVPAPAAPQAPDVSSMALKDYHRFVRSNHRQVEGPRVSGNGGAAVTFKTYAPMVLLLIGLVVGGIMALGRL